MARANPRCAQSAAYLFPCIAEPHTLVSSMTKPIRRPTAPSVVSLISAAVAVVLSCFIIATKGRAEEPSPKLERPRASLVAKIGTPAGSAPLPALAPAGAPASDEKKPPPIGPGERLPIDSAVVGPRGGVPTHSTGRFRSPFGDPEVKAPVSVRVGMLLASVRQYDIKEGTFEADFFLSLTSDQPMPKMDLEFANGREDHKSVLADTPTFKLFHYAANFFSPVDLRDYPFDTQKLVMEIEENTHGTDAIRLIPEAEHSNLDDGFQVPGWEVSYIESRTLNHYYPDRFDNDDMYYPQYQFHLGIKRFATSAAFTVFVPAIVIVLISLSGLWLPRAELEVRSNASAPMLAAAVLFHFALMQALPATAYLTRADKVMLAVYASLMLNMIATWLWFVFHERHEEAIFRYGRMVVPPLTVAFMLGGSFL
jgi:hypothetical protein